jgi:GH24 family phage-related lysozyme (muramidase)
MIKEIQIIEIEKNLNEVFSYLIQEDLDKSSPTFEWDLTNEKIKKSTKNIKTVEQAKAYLDIVFKMFKKVPKKIKYKLLKYFFISLVGIIGYSQLFDYSEKNAPELKDEISLMKNDLKSADKIIKKKKFFSIPKKTSEEGKLSLKKEEGEYGETGEPVLVAYDIKDKSITIGWGHAERKSFSQYKVGDVISRKRAEELFKQDLKAAEDAVNDVFKAWKDKGIEFYIDQDMYDAMVSMAFNMGRSGFRSTDFIQLVKKGKYEEAKERILTTNVTHEGHIERRERESEMFGKQLDKNPFIVSKIDNRVNISENYKKRLKKLAGII